MDITFDPTKDAINIAKHEGVSLALAHKLAWNTLLSTPDARRDYGEKRMIGYALFEDRLYCVVFVDQGALRRIISLRKANVREVKYYASTD